MRRSQRIFTFILLAGFFQAGYLPVFELNGSLKLAALFIFVRLGIVKLGDDGEAQLQAKTNS